MKVTAKHIGFFFRADSDRPEVEEVRTKILNRLLYIFLLIGLPAACMGVIQSYMQGRWIFSLIYASIYIAFLMGTFASRRLHFKIRALILVAPLFLFAFAILLRIGMSGVGLQLMLGACFIAALLYGMRAGLLVMLTSLACIIYVAFGMTIGFIEIYPDQMLTSRSSLAWITGLFVFFIMVSITIIAPELLRQRVEESMDLLQVQKNNVEAVNNQLQQEIQAHRKAETALKESEEKFRILADSSPTAIIVYQNDKFLYANSASTKIMGYTEEELQTMNFWAFIHPDDKQMVQERGQKRQIGEAITPRYEFRIITKDGNVKWLDLSGATIIINGSPAGITSIMDITDRKLAEEEREQLQSQLTQAQKMESVGRLAGGVAHDFNNMLGVILGRTEIAIMKSDPKQPLYKDLQEIRKAADRSADLTRQLLAFARKQTIAPIVLDLNEVIEGMLKMLRRLIGEDIDLVWLPEASPSSVKIDPSQIDQILANLCVNARDAIAGVGKVTIETGNTSFDEAYCTDHVGFFPGDFVLLAVSDNGSGMDKGVLDKLFEPFFTTKGIGQGTGLGLATVYGIVKQNNGFINVYSEPGQGTTFRLYLPRHLGKADQISKDELTATELRGNETILLTEDEPSILEMTAIMLEGMGYTVLKAGTPREAIRMAEEHIGDIHLLITDVVMPGMNGRDLGSNILSRYPYIKHLFMSGYTANVIAHQGVLDKGVHFIQKPFSVSSLAAKVRDALE